MIASKSLPMAPSRSDIMRLVKLNACLIAVCLFVSMAVTATFLWSCEPKAFVRGMIVATVLPIILGVPVLSYLSFQLLKLSAAMQYLEGFAHRDALTQIPNRGSFTRLVEEKLAEMRSLSSARGALMIADADHFKAINDRWGHAVGDDALRMIGLTMSKVLQRDDVIGRLGGEEFGVFLYGSSQVAARTVAERLRAAVEAIDLRTEENELVPITISIGLIHFRQPLPFSTLYNSADRKLYLAKANGRNRIEFEDAKIEVLEDEAA